MACPTGFPWSPYLASESTSKNHLLEMACWNRPRTSPPAFAALRDLGGEPVSMQEKLSANKSAHRLSASRMKCKKSVETEKYLLVSPGYSIKRTKDHIDVTLDEQFFRGDIENVKLPNRPKTPRSFLENNVRHTEHMSPQKTKKKEKPEIREEFIEDLQEQIAKLTALVEQETSEHQKTKRKLTIELEEKITELQTQKEDDIRVLQEKHNAEVLALQQEGEAKLLQEKEEAETRYDELQKEMDLLKSSFKTYQESLSEEVNDMWMKKEAKWKESSEEQRMMELSRQRQSLMDMFEVEKKEMQKRSLQEQAMIQQSHEAQIEESWKKYRDAAQESKMLQMLKTHLQSEIREKEEMILSLRAEIKHAHEESERLRAQIHIIEQNFDKGIGKVESRYKNRIQSLMNENADLRRKLITKNEQLFSQRSRDRPGS